MVAQSTIFPIFLRAEYSDTGALNRFQSDAQRAAQTAKREFQGVGAALDQALSRQRNSTGSLDLGVDELRQAAAAQQQVAVAAREVAEATNRARKSTEGNRDAINRATRAAFEFANAEDRTSRELNEQIVALDRVQAELNQVASATDLVTNASRRGTTARGNVINSSRAERTAFIQLGQQMQDVTIQAQLGTNAFQIFSQQVPQAAFALSGLSNSANKTKAAVGGLATFLAGPYGAILFAAIAVTGGLATALIKADDAAKGTADSTRTLSEQLADAKISFDEVTAAIAQYNTETEKASRTSLQAAQSAFLLASAKLEEAEATRQALQAKIEEALQRQDSADTLARFGTGGESLGALQADRSVSDLLERQRTNQAALDGIRQEIGNRTFNLAVEQARIQGDAGAAIAEGYENARQQLRATTTDAATLREELIRLNAEEQKALDGLKQGSSRRGGAQRRDQTVQDDRFLERTAARVAQINDRFSDQTRFVQQSLQGTRQLDAILADINLRLATAKRLTAEQREEFQAIRDAADEAKDVIEDALERPFRDLRLESERRLEIETLLAQGRVDEAAGLQAVLQIEQQYGREVDLRAQVEDLISAGRNDEAAILQGFVDRYADLTAEARERSIAEQQTIRDLQAQRELIEAQANVARTVRTELTSLFSGQSTDFVANIQQSLQDLQGARIFEDLFGPAFRDIEEQLNGNTPQGRANDRYVREVEQTADATRIAGEAVQSFAEAVDAATAGVKATAANDNGTGLPNIPVDGDRLQEVEFSRRSIQEISDQLGITISEGFANELEDVLGPRFAQQFGTVLSGTLSGLLRGGTPGAILGGANGLLGSLLEPDEGFDATLRSGFLTDLSDNLGRALNGSQTGTSIAAISGALGLGGSTSGSQIGGALGGLTQIPGGDIIGALAGNFLGSIFGGSKRGSATIGGIGSELSITGISGNSTSREGAASGLADDVLDAINQVADQLGADVNAALGRVSIGVRNDDLRVDTSGNGQTKTSDGAIDFGDDTEAAIRFATRDLIQDGVIQGLNDAENRLLRAGSSLEDSIQDVLDFRSVFDRLQQIRDPLGFEIDQLNDEFENLIDVFERAGATAQQTAELEELYNLERAQIIEDVNDQVASSLRRLLDDLTIGDNGLSLRTRRTNALGEFDDLSARVQAGDTSAFDDFAEISQQLLEIERELFGSTQSYFDRLAEVTAITEQAIGDQSNITSIAEATPSPFGDPIEIDRSIDIMTDALAQRLDLLNNNLVQGLERLLITGGGVGSSVVPISAVANF